MALGILLIILMPLIIVYLIIHFTVESIRYRKTPYYKKFKKKYMTLVTSTDAVKLYNRMVTENLPMEHFVSGDYEYFVKDGVVLICGWTYTEVETADGEWIFNVEYESEDYKKLIVKDVIDEETANLKDEHKLLPVKIINAYGESDEAKTERLKECPYLYPVRSIEEFE